MVKTLKEKPIDTSDLPHAPFVVLDCKKPQFRHLVTDPKKEIVTLSSTTARVWTDRGDQP